MTDRLRPVLPMLLAISANSPYVDQHGLRAAHAPAPQTFTESFPRCGVPDAFGSWQAWADYVELLVRTESIVEFTQLWWSVRPHHDFGTVEVRICDAQTHRPRGRPARGADRGLRARRPRAEVDAGETPPDVPGRLIEENMWRAIRYGLDGKLLDLTVAADRAVPRRRGARPPEGVDGGRRRRCPSSTARSASAA